MKWIHSITIVFSIVIWGDVTGQLRSPYQGDVPKFIRTIFDKTGSSELYLRNDILTPSIVNTPKASISFHQVNADGTLENVNLCNGAIIHERFILTTADCLYVQINSTNVKQPKIPSMYQVAAGTFGADPSSTRHAESIYIHEKYNTTTFENDIALILLNEPLQLKSNLLQNNPSIQWIEIDNRKAKYENCFTSPHNHTSKGYPFTAPQSTYVIENWFCDKRLSPPSSSVRNGDICSYYNFNDSSMCKLQPEEFRLSSDRGTPLVCDYHLSGLLSQIIPAQTSEPNTLCEQTLKTWAIYTNVTNYIGWIHKIIDNPQLTPSHTKTHQTSTLPSYSNPEQPPSTTNTQSQTNAVERNTKSLTTIMLFSSINLILTQIQFKI